jgi:hypothetical protein
MKIKLLYTVIAFLGSSFFASPKDYTATCTDTPCNRKMEIKAATLALKSIPAAEDLGQSPLAHFFTLEI